MLPHELVGPVLAQKQSVDLHTSTLAQAIVARARRAAWYPAHLDRLRAEYATRADSLCAALAAHPDVFAPCVRPAGGLFVWTALRPELDVDTTALLPKSVEHGVAYVPGAAFADDERRAHAMRLSFATCSPVDLHTAVTRLAAAIGGCVPTGPPVGVAMS